jgi:fumarylacetoacetase
MQIIKQSSWVSSANIPNCDFPLENLPWGSFRVKDDVDANTHIGVAIGSKILCFSKLGSHVEVPEELQEAFSILNKGQLNPYMNLSQDVHQSMRHWLTNLLSITNSDFQTIELHLINQSDVSMLKPCFIHDYTDFYASIHHATSVGKMLRPDAPLSPNYKWLPVAYHGRASSIQVSGANVKRPSGQMRASEGKPPYFRPSRRLDFELELGIFIGTGNALGDPVSMAQAEEHFFGMCILNDWSARDIQGWEGQPLGPFLGKNFSTTISPWIVTKEALAPFRKAWTRTDNNHEVLDYLSHPKNSENGSISIQLEVELETAAMREAGLPAHRLTQSEFSEAAYWTIAQLITHHTSNGCNLQSGDLLGTGTLSGINPENAGSLLELSQGGKKPIQLANGQERSFLEDGDELTIKAYCELPNQVRIGFGECRNRIIA